MKLTFNLDDLYNFQFFTINPNFLKIDEERTKNEPWRRFRKPKEREEILQISFKVSSTEIREFIDEVFGIGMDIDQSHHRNTLNKMIKRVVPMTQRGKRTYLNFYQFRDLILLEEFNRFILDNLQIDRKVENTERMYQEIMYLQMNKYFQTSMYRVKKKKKKIKFML